MATIKIEDAKFNPTRFFKRPADVLNNKDLTRNEKVDILKSWAYDELDKSVAEEENMQDPENKRANILDEVAKALVDLGADIPRSPTKQG